MIDDCIVNVLLDDKVVNAIATKFINHPTLKLLAVIFQIYWHHYIYQVS